jgi:hypothetical protein
MSQGAPFVQSDVIALIALDFVLRVVGIGVMRVALVIDVFGMHAHDAPADASGFRIPAHVIAGFECLYHIVDTP